MNTEPVLKIQEGSVVIRSAIPRFCFICGMKLTKVGWGWLQCESEQCGEIYLPFMDKDKNQCLMHQRNPFSPT